MEAMPSPADQRVLAQVSDAIRARDTKRAAMLADTALATGLRHPLLFNARAIWLGEQNRDEEALAEFRRAEAMSPPNAAILSAIATCLFKLERPAEAIEILDQAIALQPNPMLYCRKGHAHETAQDPGGARHAYEHAIELQPDFAEALGRLAYLAARRGDWAEARRLAERCLTLDPRQTAAHLALVSVDLEEGLYDPAQARLIMLLAGQASGGADRYLALGLLGDLRDRQGRVNEAFETYTNANRQSEALHSKRFAGPKMFDIVSALIAQMEKAAPLRRTASPANAQTSHIFLLGFLRSGTTLLEQILASHPGVVALGEKDTLADSVRAFMTEPSDLDKLFAAGDAALAQYRDLYWQRVREFGVEPHGKVFVDKMPINTVKLAVIQRIFPQAKIMFAIRDPRDVVLSCFRRTFDINASTYEFLTLERTARFYDAVMRLSELYRAKLPLNLYPVRHEDLVTDFEGQMRKLCAATGLSWDDAMRNFAGSARPVASASSAQLARGLNSEGVGQWRRYAAHLAPVMPLLKPWIKRFGYPQQ